MSVTSCLLCGRWDGEQLLEVHRGEHMLKAETPGEQAQSTHSTCPGCVSSDLHLVTDNEASEIQLLCYRCREHDIFSVNRVFALKT